MKILVLDNDELLIQGLKYINTIKKEFSYVYYNELDKSKISFDDINLVIVDFEIDEYFTLFKKIIEHDKKKKVIVASQKLESCVDVNCDECLEKYKIRRIVKPIELDSLFNLMESSFEEKTCGFYESFSNISSILPCVIKRYSSLVYNEEKKLINAVDRVPSNIYTYEMISLVNILEQNSIKYTVLDDKKIQIL